MQQWRKVVWFDESFFYIMWTNMGMRCTMGRMQVARHTKIVHECSGHNSHTRPHLTTYRTQRGVYSKHLGARHHSTSSEGLWSLFLNGSKLFWWHFRIPTQYWACKFNVLADQFIPYFCAQDESVPSSGPGRIVHPSVSFGEHTDSPVIDLLKRWKHSPLFSAIRKKKRILNRYLTSWLASILPALCMHAGTHTLPFQTL